MLDSVTVVPPVGAAPLRVTVQAEDPGPVTVDGVQLKPVTRSWACGADTLRAVVAMLPFNDATNVALTAVVVDAAEAVKLALVCPDLTTTLAGTVTVALLLDSATVVPPVGAVALIVTVQFAVAGPVTAAGVQLKPVACS